jgi:hypothetical protein
MNAVRALPRPIAAVLALTLALLLAIPLMGAKGSNASGAKACQKGGYATLATSEDPYGAFPDQDVCVAYAARGGTLTALVVAHGSAQFVWVEAWGECNILFDAKVPAGMSSDIQVWFANASISSSTIYPLEYPISGGIGLEAGATMTSAAGRYYTYPGPLIPFPVTPDPEPCGPRSTAE